jgi:hypothetical protein
MANKDVKGAGNLSISRRPRHWVVGAVVLAVIVLATIFIWSSNFGQKIFRPAAEWYAVHLTNGVVYVGQIKSINADTIVLTKSFYMQSYGAGKNLQGEAAQFYGLVRQGVEAPLLTDQVLFINRPTVLFWERLDSQSDVVQKLDQQN